jgi:hypothetical protein
MDGEVIWSPATAYRQAVNSLLHFAFKTHRSQQLGCYLKHRELSTITDLSE